MSLVAAQSVRRHGIASLLLLGFLAGASAFWITETGVYMIAIGAFCLWHVTVGHVRAAGVALIYIGMSIATFMALSTFAFGTGVLNFEFITSLFAPAILYGSGFGAWPVNWLAPYEYSHQRSNPPDFGCHYHLGDIHLRRIAFGQ